MTVGIVDTTVVVHYFRQYPPARAWVDSQPARLSLVSITWLEMMQGAGSKAKQATSEGILGRFDTVYLTSVDQQWAMAQLKVFRLSHGVTFTDCLIAAVAQRLQVPLYTHNLKDMTPLIGSLAVGPYS